MNRRNFITASAATLTAGIAGSFTRSATAQQPGAKRRVIDVHNHWTPPKWTELMEKEAAANGAKTGRNSRGDLTFEKPGTNPVSELTFSDIESRLKMMDQKGITMHALSMTTSMIDWAPPAFALKLSQVFNDECSALHLKYPDRFVGLALVPMQDPALAVTEIDRVAKLSGIRGIYLGTKVGNKNLDDKSFWPVYERCANYNLPILLHPIDPVGAERMGKYFLRNLLGNPYDTGIAAACLMFGGVLDAFPRLDVALPHAGGAFPWLIGRMNHGSAVRPEAKNLAHPPPVYLSRFYYDTITHSGQILTDLARLVGSNRLVPGTDYPADMGDDNVVNTVDSLTSLSQSERDEILGANPARLLRL